MVPTHDVVVVRGVAAGIENGFHPPLTRAWKAGPMLASIPQSRDCVVKDAHCGSREPIDSEQFGDVVTTRGDDCATLLPGCPVDVHVP